MFPKSLPSILLALILPLSASANPDYLAAPHGAALTKLSIGMSLTKATELIAASLGGSIKPATCQSFKIKPVHDFYVFGDTLVDCEGVGDSGITNFSAYFADEKLTFVAFRTFSLTKGAPRDDQAHAKSKHDRQIVHMDSKSIRSDSDDLQYSSRVEIEPCGTVYYFSSSTLTTPNFTDYQRARIAKADDFVASKLKEVEKMRIASVSFKRNAL